MGDLGEIGEIGEIGEMGDLGGIGEIGKLGGIGSLELASVVAGASELPQNETGLNAPLHFRISSLHCLSSL
ncbi:MAG: hypothetical protein K2H96_04840 [Muribaculaceae bacterium]|nr:hypothetical protein [Muribaculaceae bacterium]